MLNDFTQLEAWKKAMELAVKIHKITSAFPKEELYGIVSQMRRAASSVPANIAEGFGRQTSADKLHKYVQARGELTELKSHIHYCRQVDYLESDEERDLLLTECSAVHKLLNGLIHRMRPEPSTPNP
jgi:four helix bundle protein